MWNLFFHGNCNGRHMWHEEEICYMLSAISVHFLWMEPKGINKNHNNLANCFLFQFPDILGIVRIWRGIQSTPTGWVRCLVYYINNTCQSRSSWILATPKLEQCLRCELRVYTSSGVAVSTIALADICLLLHNSEEKLYVFSLVLCL